MPQNACRRCSRRATSSCGHSRAWPRRRLRCNCRSASHVEHSRSGSLSRRSRTSTRRRPERLSWLKCSHPGGGIYRSWSLYLKSMTLLAIGPERLSAQWVRTFQRPCEEFAVALEKTASPFLCSYPGEAWPADTAVGVAALAIHDRVQLSLVKVVGPPVELRGRRAYLAGTLPIVDAILAWARTSRPAMNDGHGDAWEPVLTGRWVLVLHVLTAAVLLLGSKWARG